MKTLRHWNVFQEQAQAEVWDSVVSRRSEGKSKLRILKVVFAVTSVAICGACASMQKAKPVDLSSPKSAATAYVKAIQVGDAPTARAAASGTAQEMDWVDGWAGFARATRDLNNAIYTRFGKVTHQIHAELEKTLWEQFDRPAAQIGDADVQAAENEARITIVHGTVASRDSTPLLLKKINGLWKIDLERTYLPEPPRNQLLVMTAGQRAQYKAKMIKDVSDAFRLLQKESNVMEGLAGDVKTGRFKTMDAVLKALNERAAAVR